MGKMKKFVILMAIFMLTIASCIRYADSLYVKSDTYAMQRTVSIKGKYGQCSGEQIEAPSGETYILTAAHCRNLADDGISMVIITEDEKRLMRKIIAEDSYSDLLLLEGIPNLDGIKIA